MVFSSGLMIPLIALICITVPVRCNVTEDRPNSTCQDIDTFTMVSSVNHLGFSIASRLYDDEAGNFLYSPLGLSSALGMAYLGARGQTAKQIEEALMYEALGISGQEVHEHMSNMTSDTMSRVKNRYNLNLANACFLQRGLDIEENFANCLRTYYNTTSEDLDFGGDPQTSLDAINEWVRRSTFNKIRKILDKPLQSNTAMFITNAIYFKGEWKVQFSAGRTIHNYFHVASKNEDKVVPIMSMSKERFRYLRSEQLGYKFLELPYKGEEISMLFALPLQYNRIPDLNMTSDLFCSIRSNMSDTKLDIVAIPRFKIEFKKNLKSVLSSVGIVDAFEPGSADFSGVFKSGKSAALYLSDVLHKAVIEVNEQGSEAAAVSGIPIMAISALGPPEFIANHSFLFYIIEARTGLVLFTGRVMEP